MSVVTYNGVQLPYATTTNFAQATRKDGSDTDWHLIDYDIQVTCIINTDYLVMIANDLVGQESVFNPANILQLLRKRLMVHRKKLSFTYNGRELVTLPQTGLPGTVDAENGPKPVSCDCLEMNNQTWILMYHIKGAYWECNTTTGQGVIQNTVGRDVLYNRWSENVTLDENQMSRRVREGIYVIRSDNVHGSIADSYRSDFAVVGVPIGWIRVSSYYAIDPDGLKLRYRVEDREVYLTPPSPAFTARGNYSETSAPYNGQPMRLIQCNVEMTADKLTSKVQLFNTCVGVAISKVIAALNPNETFIPVSARVSTELYENKVDCAIEALSPPLPGSSDGSNQGKGIYTALWGFSRWANFATTPGAGSQGDGFQPPGYFDRGSAGVLLQAAAYNDPCLQATLDGTTGQMLKGLAPGQAGQQLETSASTTTGMPQQVLFHGTENQEFTLASVLITPIDYTNFNARYQPHSPDLSFFTEYYVENEYENDQHKYMGGLTSPSGFNGSTVAFVQLAMPTTLLVSKWTALKALNQPEYPTYQISDGSPWLILDAWFTPASMTTGSDGTTVLYRLSGVYIFGAKNPSAQITNDMNFPRPAWLNPAGVDRTLPATKQIPDLIFSS
jgi:hypothetical protein